MRHPLLSNKAKAVFFTLLAGALWGTSFPIIKIGLKSIDPFTFLFWRFLVSCITLAVVMLLLKKFQFNIADKKLLILLGIANGAGYLLQYVGMPYTTAAKAALFINLSAMWVAILSPRLLGENISLKKVAGVLFGLVGIVFVSTNLDFSSLSQGQLAADALLIISGVTWALFMVYNKKLVMNSTTATFQTMTWVLIYYVSFNCTIFCLVWTRLFCVVSLGMGINYLDRDRLLGHTLLFVAGGTQTSFSFHLYGSSFIRNRGSRNRLSDYSERAYHRFLIYRRLPHSPSHNARLTSGQNKYKKNINQTFC